MGRLGSHTKSLLSPSPASQSEHKPNRNSSLLSARCFFVRFTKGTCVVAEADSSSGSSSLCSGSSSSCSGSSSLCSGSNTGSYSGSYTGSSPDAINHGVVQNLDEARGGAGVSSHLIARTIASASATTRRSLLSSSELRHFL